MARQTKTGSSRPPKSKPASDIALPGEKVVKETSQSVEVKPVKAGREAKRPIPPAALDRRRDVAPSGPAGEARRRAPRRPSGA